MGLPHARAASARCWPAQGSHPSLCDSFHSAVTVCFCAAAARTLRAEIMGFVVLLHT